MSKVGRRYLRGGGGEVGRISADSTKGIQKSLQFRVACPNFGHPAQAASFTKYLFLQVKNIFVN